MFSNPLICQQLDGYKWKVHEGFTFVSANGFKIDIPKGFVTDLASVPRMFWWFISPAGRHSQACVVHDFMYDNAIETKAKADQLLYEGLIELGVPDTRAKIMYWCVRAFGRGSYAK